VVLSTVVVRAATPVEVWPVQTQVLNATGLKAQLGAIDATVPSLPEPVRPAAQFQKIFLQMLSGVPKETWRAELEKHTQRTSGDTASQALGDLARVWLARVQMEDLDGALRKYYRHNVRFPDALPAALKDVPASLQNDPWGRPWVYQLKAPPGFPKQKDQRYQLGPTRFPQLTTFAEATRKRTPTTIPWKITSSAVGGGTAMEFRAPGAAAPMAVLQPGGTVSGFVLVFVGNRWALMAAQDQLFAVVF
jgi:hypothetical protein